SDSSKIAIANTLLNNANTISEAAADEVAAGGVKKAAPVTDQSLHKWFFISGSKI
ncbi:hypothetical protein GGH92_010070, partial [Coemansia sp. RSA 2673]